MKTRLSLNGMRKSFLILLSSSLIVAISSCEKNSERRLPPVIQVDTNYDVSYEGGEYRIPYSVENKDGDVELSVTADPEWISILSVNSSEIIFSVAENTDEDRSAVISLSCPGAEDVEIIVKQAGCTFTDLSIDGTANSYIISEAGVYGFWTVEGNSSKPIDGIESAELLWESFGTDIKPEVGDLISKVNILGDYVVFSTSETFREGNALLAVKDENGKILWSWHIWMTDIPEDQVYNNGAGTMMDRNLGAVSSTPGDVGALGLLYQWGRKDPFIGSSSISESIPAACTIEWPDVVYSDKETGTIEYAISNPTVFIMANGNNSDWLYSDEADMEDDTRWYSQKTLYDPCPPGYHVPVGDTEGVWAVAWGDKSLIMTVSDEANVGINFGSASENAPLTLSESCWYPFSGYISGEKGELKEAGYTSYVWSNTLKGKSAYCVVFDGGGFVIPVSGNVRSNAQSVRCVKD